MAYQGGPPRPTWYHLSRYVGPMGHRIRLCPFLKWSRTVPVSLSALSSSPLQISPHTARLAAMECVFGLVGDGFALIAADTSAVHSILVHKSNEDKVMILDSHKLLGASGEGGDRFVSSFLLSFLSEHPSLILDLVRWFLIWWLWWWMTGCSSRNTSRRTCTCTSSGTASPSPLPLPPTLPAASSLSPSGR